MTNRSNKNLPMPLGKLTALNGFRGMLAIFVAVFHTPWSSKIVDQPFFQQGTVMVDLFFVFSGFLMYALYASRLSNAEQARAFLKRRFARIYPIHLFMLILMTGFAFFRVIAHEIGLAESQVGEILPFETGAQENWNSFFANLFMLHATGITGGLSFNFPSWTISGDIIVYILFALLMMFVPPKKFLHFIPLLTVSVLIYGFLYTQKPDMNITYDYGAIRVLAGFIVGMFGAYLFVGIKQANHPSLAIYPNKLASIMEIMATSAFVYFVIYMGGKQQFLVGPFALVFVVVFAFNAGLISRIISNKLFLYLAKISYSIYMVHIIVAIVMGTIADRFIAPNLSETLYISGWVGDFYLIPYLAIVIGFSHLTWKYVEIPGNQIILKCKINSTYHKARGAIFSA